MEREVSTVGEKPAINQAGSENARPVRRESEKHTGTHVPFVHKDKHQDPEWDGSEVDFSHINTKKVLRKMDIRLIPNLALLYLLSFLDRGNIGNARIQGLTEDLGAFEPPSNLLLKRLRPSVWLPIIMVAWGIVMTSMGTVSNYGGLLSTRLFLGIAEAGLFPGVAYFLSEWYVREEMQYRQALFFSAASVAGAFSGLLAFAIAKMDGVGGYAGWRWIFILEGLLTVVIGVLSFWTLYDFPDTASFLSIEERAWVVHRLRYQGVSPEAKKVAQANRFQWRYVKAAFIDPQIYIGLIMYWGIVAPLYGISFFLPTIIRDLGYTASAAQLLTIPIYITAAAIAIISAYFSDRHGQRSPFILFFIGMIAIGFVVVLASTGRGVPGVVYAGVFIAVAGIYPAFPGNITWISNNLAGSYKRAAGMAIHIGAGNLAGAMASNFYRAQDGPNYYLGHSLELGFCVAGIIAAVALRIGYERVNKRRDAKGTGEMSPEELSDLGDKSPSFRYVL
ncbi:hypothetical protein GJ744_008512 [Endocarpon pusillum]|uniref:Major facilitator superfamily (MFS) profile domain-containing protein n=1 Tax=Endocarpon pusillum TaxID=364733 RepID=A0A8H7AL15_9EURO|nr:hypothetical protein GJ744_008512 [Endocarpon pusillum]